jgi:hypothetical protein
MLNACEPPVMVWRDGRGTNGSHYLGKGRSFGLALWRRLDTEFSNTRVARFGLPFVQRRVSGHTLFARKRADGLQFWVLNGSGGGPRHRLSQPAQRGRTSPRD